MSAYRCLVETIDTLLLLGLPASRKSEIRRYLAHVDPAIATRDFRLGPTVHLDDYPYVHLMRRVAQEVRAAGADPVFFASDEDSMLEPRDWGTLARLLAQDYAALAKGDSVPKRPAAHLLARCDEARVGVGVTPVTDQIPGKVLDRVIAALNRECAEFFAELGAQLARYNESATVIVELARGGPRSTPMPLPEPLGYSYTLAALGDAMLSRASILHVRVSHEQSRHRNRERARSGLEGDASILYHGVPEGVMVHDYGVDDMPQLIEDGGGKVLVRTDDATHRLSVAVFDNENDHTSFLRKDLPTEGSGGVADRRGRCRPRGVALSFASPGEHLPLSEAQSERQQPLALSHSLWLFA